MGKIFSEDQESFIQKHVNGLSNKELTKQLNEFFNTNFTVKQVKWLKYTHHLNGDIKKRNMPIGSEIIKNDYVFIKTAEPAIWEEKHRVIYEAAYGKIPKGCKIMFLDGNKRNFNIDNLKLVKNSEEMFINKNKYAGICKEFTEVAISLAKLKNKISEEEK